MQKSTTQLEQLAGIAIQVEMLKLMKPYPLITEAEWTVIVQKAYVLIKTLGLDKELASNEIH